MGSDVPLSQKELIAVMRECDETASRVHDFRDDVPAGDRRGEFDRAVWRIHNLLRPAIAALSDSQSEGGGLPDDLPGSHDDRNEGKVRLAT